MTVTGPNVNTEPVDSVTRIVIAWDPLEKRLARKDETKPGFGVALLAYVGNTSRTSARGRPRSARLANAPSTKSSILSTRLKSRTQPLTLTTPETRWPWVGWSMAPIGCARANG